MRTDNLNIEKMNYEELKEELKAYSSNEIISFFESNIEKIKAKSISSENINALIEVMPVNLKLKYGEYYNFNWKSISEFFAGITMEEDIYNAAKIALNNTSAYDVCKVFSFVPYVKREEFLDLILKREKDNNEKIINNYNIDSYLNKFNIDERLDVLKNIFKKFQIETLATDRLGNSYVKEARLNSIAYDRIIKTFATEKNPDLFQSKMFTCLEFLCEECQKIRDNFNEVAGLLYPERIVEVFYDAGYNQNQIIEYLVNSGVIGYDGLGTIVKNIPENTRKDSIKFILNMHIPNRKVSHKEFFQLLGNLSFEDAKEFYIQYCFVEKRFKYIYVINKDFLGHSSFDYLSVILNTLSKEELEEAFPRIRIAFCEIIKYPKYDENYDLIIDFFSQKFNIDSENVKVFVKKFGYNILKYLDNENIRRYIYTDNDKVEKLFNFFTEDTIIINKSTINDVLNSLLQREFRLENSDIYNIFAKIQNNGIDDAKKILKEISLEYDYSKVLEEYNISLDDLNTQNREEYLNILHKITNKYIAHKREVFVKENLPIVSEQLKMEKVITRESYKSKMLQNTSSGLSKKCREVKGVKFTEDQEYLLNNNNLLWELLQFKENPKGYVLDSKYKKYLHTLSELLDILYDNKVDFNTFKVNSPYYKDLKFELTQGEVSNEFLIGVLLESNYDGVTKVLENDDSYNTIKEFLEKYKIMGWEDIFANVMSSADIQFDEGIIASLISNEEIVKYINDKNTLTSIIDHANCYSMVSSFYRILFGMENYNLIATNPGPNKASMSKYERLNGCRDLVPLMYNKKSFSIPTFDEEFKTNNGANFRVIVGNATNMMNLTYGERTDSCMRKGGPFEELFKFCITDKNGFHIRIVNPRTGNLISRVSGLRNGNTVFLNELRCSLDDDYSNEDLYEVMKLVSNHLIELSRESNMPIDNVIITSDYALESHQNESKDLNLTESKMKKALRGVSFNLIDKGILLANSQKDDQIIPYKFSDDLPEYATIRDESKVYYGDYAVNRILQIRLINDMVNAIPYENINIEYDGDVPDYIVSGEDYYIAYKDGNIMETFILDSRKNDSRTLAEIKNILEGDIKEDAYEKSR